MAKQRRALEERERGQLGRLEARLAREHSVTSKLIGIADARSSEASRDEAREAYAEWFGEADPTSGYEYE